MKKLNNNTISKRTVWFKRLAILFLLLMIPAGAYALTAEISPDDISIGLGYHGTELTVTGQRNVDEDIILMLSSASSESKLKYKGKAGGVFWMKMGNMAFKPVPMVYMIYAPGELKGLLPAEILLENRLGYEALSEGIDVESPQQNIDEAYWINEFIKFKEHEQLYSVNAVSDNTSLQQGSTDYRYQIDWPYQAPPGDYQLEVFAVKNNTVVGHSTSEFQVQRSGMVSFLSSLAFNRAAIYGLVAILVASLAGFSVGLIFKGGGAH